MGVVVEELSYTFYDLTYILLFKVHGSHFPKIYDYLYDWYYQHRFSTNDENVVSLTPFPPTRSLLRVMPDFLL